MKKILYLSNVSWKWIKQRPQFLAEGLSMNYQVDVYYRVSLRGRDKKMPTEEIVNDEMHLTLNTYKTFPFDKIPLFGKIKWFDNINKCLMRRYLPNFSDYDYIWLCTPFSLHYIIKLLTPRNKIIYDCMDDLAAFPSTMNNLSYLNEVLAAEKKLMQYADIILCSAQYLAETITKRSGINREITILNNAIELPPQNSISRDDMPIIVQNKYDFVAKLTNVLLYVGTVAEWFDFKKMQRLLDEDPSLNLVVIGPCYGLAVPAHPRIYMLGAINRDYIFAFMEKAIALIMPFEVIPLIESVNPVKLYEYIYSGKPSIAPYYSESAKFGQFVQLYHNYDELKKIVLDVKSGNIIPFSKNVIAEFVNENTWKKRIDKIEEVLSHN